MARQEINIFGTSFLYLLFGALAAVIILSIIMPKMSVEHQKILEDDSFSAYLLPETENSILPANDVNQLKPNMQQLEKAQHFLMGDLIKKAYTKYRLGQSSSETSEAVDSQSKIYNSEMDREQAFIQIGTILDIADSLGNEPYLIENLITHLYK